MLNLAELKLVPIWQPVPVGVVAHALMFGNSLPGSGSSLSFEFKGLFDSLATGEASVCL
jgi:hypothetical protein